MATPKTAFCLTRSYTLVSCASKKQHFLFYKVVHIGRKQPCKPNLDTADGEAVTNMLVHPALLGHTEVKYVATTTSHP